MHHFQSIVEFKQVFKTQITSCSWCLTHHFITALNCNESRMRLWLASLCCFYLIQHFMVEVFSHLFSLWLLWGNQQYGRDHCRVRTSAECRNEQHWWLVCIHQIYALIITTKPQFILTPEHRLSMKFFLSSNQALRLCRNVDTIKKSDSRSQQHFSCVHWENILQ